MNLRRFTTSVDGTIPIPALLYEDEELLASQDNVGIYDGLQKAAKHQAGATHVSSHRLFFVNYQSVSHSFSMDLALVVRTDHYAGLFKSSPKVTLYLDPSFVPPSGTRDGVTDAFEGWVCDVCHHRNPPGLSPAAARVCALCGVPRSALSGTPERQASSLSTSHPASSVPLPSAFLTLSRSSTPPQPSGEPPTIACGACTFLNHPFLRNCEICSTPLPLSPGNSGINTKSAPPSRPVSPPLEDNVSDPANPLIKLSFRKGGDRMFYTILRRALKARAWEVSFDYMVQEIHRYIADQGRQMGKGSRSGSSSLGVPSPDGGSTPGSLRRSGIDGILRNVEASAQNTETELSDAFKDLEALMVKARDLVQLAAELNEKLGASSSSPSTALNHTTSPPGWIAPSSTTLCTSSMFTTTSLVPSSEPEEARFVRSSLAQLGLQLSNAPVTADMIQDEKRWMEELARELARVLQGSGDEGPEQKGGGLMKERGIIGLDEVWGGWNRARGVSLIPPSTFLETLQHLPTHTCPPIRSRTFPSGLQVLHTPPYTHAAFAARLSSYLTISGAQKTSHIAREENMTMSLATEMILAVEGDGVICRDDEGAAIRGGGSGSGSEVGWTVNTFGQYVWDGAD